MSILLTGSTGNVGSALLQRLLKHGDEVTVFSRVPIDSDQYSVIVGDLTKENSLISDISGITMIIHCAGNVSFKHAGESNTLMMKSIIGCAQSLDVPVIYVSTAFLYRGRDIFIPRNSYEQDKYNAERMLIESGIQYKIIRPSVIVGRRESGEIKNFSGMYRIIQVLEKILKDNQGVVRFPMLSGTSNIVSVDDVVEAICIIKERKLFDTEIEYVVNNSPPSAHDVLQKILVYLDAKEAIKSLDISFDMYEALEDLSSSEYALVEIGKHMKDYWALDYLFPKTDLVPVSPISLEPLLKYYSNNRS